MLFRNKDLKRALIGFFLFGGLLLPPAFLHSSVVGLWTLLCWATCTGMFLVVERRRYKKLQSISQDLDALLLHGSTIPIAFYEEGELSALAHQVQKLTQKLMEARDASRKDKLFLADSLADISHQLRTPLTAMHLTLSLLREPEKEPGKHRELLRDFRSLLHRTQWLVEALLKLSKLDAGTVQFHSETVPLRDLFLRAAEPFHIVMELQEQTLSIQCGECSIYCDPVWTTEAIGNVLKNAIEHSPPGKEICLTGRDTPIFTEIVILDQGKGFSPEELPHIFERFYRGKEEDPKSCGIGLSLSHSILAAQNGSIRAENWEKGGKFTLKLYKQPL